MSPYGNKVRLRKFCVYTTDDCILDFKLLKAQVEYVKGKTMSNGEFFKLLIDSFKNNFNVQ